MNQTPDRRARRYDLIRDRADPQEAPVTDDKPHSACSAPCPHGAATCTLPSDHRGRHEVYGDRYPGNPRKKSICTWKRNR